MDRAAAGQHASARAAPGALIERVHLSRNAGGTHASSSQRHTRAHGTIATPCGVLARQGYVLKPVIRGVTNAPMGVKQ